MSEVLRRAVFRLRRNGSVRFDSSVTVLFLMGENRLENKLHQIVCFVVDFDGGGGGDRNDDYVSGVVVALLLHSAVLNHARLEQLYCFLVVSNTHVILSIFCFFGSIIVALFCV